MEATQGQMDGFFSRLSYTCHFEWHLWEIDLRVALNSTPGWSACDKTRLFIHAGASGAAETVVRRLVQHLCQPLEGLGLRAC